MCHGCRLVYNYTADMQEQVEDGHKRPRTHSTSNCTGLLECNYNSQSTVRDKTYAL